jgi:hypothetical protein
MKKKIYKAKDNKYVTRQTDRTYTHAVFILRNTDGNPCLWTFCGNENLAQKKYREYQRMGYGNEKEYTIKLSEVELVK